MKCRSILVIAFVVSFAAVGLAQSDSFMVAGVMRNFIVHAPSSGLSNPPFVYILHGFNMSAASMVSITRMNTIADRDKFIVVYPNALPNDSNQQSWDLSGPNDFSFLLAIIDTIDAKYHIDRNRVYAAGFSQGGFLCFSLACKYADIFAAIAPVSGLSTGTCKLKRPVPMFLTFGTNDVATTTQFMSSVTTWLKLDTCPSTPVVTQPYPSSNPNSLVTRLVYGPCAQGTEVTVDSILTGQHEWPMNTKDRVNNSEEVWAFMKRFSLKGNSAIRQQTDPLSRACISATYRSGIVRLQGTGENCRVRITDSKGSLVAATNAVQRHVAFKDKPSGVYVVLMSGKEGATALRIVVP